ncbi:MAG: hypothetical protein WCP21_21405 [Armatimonadota bacterium]
MVRARGWLSEAWALVGADLPVFAVAAFLTITGSLFTGFILALPMVAGLCLMFSEKLQGNRPELAQLWEGLSSRFPAAISIWIIMMLAAIPFDGLNYYLHSLRGPWPWVGVLAVFAGLWLVYTPLFFAIPLIADRDVSALTAIRLSWSQVRPRWGGIFFATALYSLVMMVGVLACGVGIILTLPVVVGAQMLAYHELLRDVEIPQMIPIKDPGTGGGESHEES